MKKIIFILYFVLGLGNVLGYLWDIEAMTQYTKPMLMPVLLYGIYLLFEGHVTLTRLLLAGSIIFSWLGDLALMQDSETYFLMGMASFFLTHCLYSYLYFRTTYDRITFRLMPVVPILIFVVFFYTLVLPKVPEPFTLPLILYGIVITLMACLSRLREGLTSEKSFQWVVVGSMLFVVSDALIAYNKFYMVLPFASELIMATYIGAQYLITRGILFHTE